MRINLYCINQIRHWSKGCQIRKLCTQQHDIYVYNPDQATHMCELRPSYEMDFVYSIYRTLPEIEALTEEAMEDLEEALRENAPDGTSSHCSQVDVLPVFLANTVPTELPEAFVIEWDEDAEEPESAEDDPFEAVKDYLHGNPPL